MLTHFLIIIISFEGLYSYDYRLHRKGKYTSRRRSQIYDRLKTTMEENGVVPDVIDTVPKDKIQIRYPSGVDVDYGNELTPLSVKDQPIVNWPVESGQLYTLVMTDPDAPNRKEQTYGQVKHWVVVNIPGTDLSKGETLAEYIGSLPPENSGLHRYIFIVYKQSGHLEHSETIIKGHGSEGRLHFKVREFAKKYNLGEPIACNFYQAQHDEYVREIRAKWAQKQ